MDSSAKHPDSVNLTAQWLNVLPSLSAYIGAVVPDVHQANELLQAVAVAVVEHQERYDRDRPFKAWVLGIARNKVLQWRRRQATDRHLFGEAALNQIHAAYEKLGDEVDHRLIALRQCIEQLPAHHRRMVQLRYGEGLKPRHIAEREASQPRAVSMMLSRIRAALRECIERRLERPS